MKPLKLNRFMFMIMALALATLACSGGQSPVQPVATDQPQAPSDSGSSNDGLSQSERSNLISATVQIYGMFNQNGKLVPGYVGSGTIISPTGLILTNAHVASPASQGNKEEEPDALAIGIVQSEDHPAVFSYLADVKAVDGFLDIAVIQIASTIDGDSISSDSLNLPFVKIGNSDAVHIGDHVSIFGFPAIGGETITYTDGNVSGFTSEEQLGDRAWIKTDATISGGNSGGLAANDTAQIIGIPSIASSGADTDITDCRVVQDTNGDGQLTDKDTCIPIGGFINGIRPVNLALPLIKAAQGGQTYSSPFDSGVATADSTGKEKVSNFQWYKTDKDGRLTDPIDSYDNTVDTIAVAFDFSGFVDGQGWGDKWYLNDEKIYDGTYTWSGGSSGQSNTYINTTDGSALPEGTYKVELYVDNGGGAIGSSTVNVGNGGGNTGTPSKPAANGVTLFGNIYDADTNKPLDGAYVFVLNPGVTYEQWADKNFPQEDIYSYTQSDSNGDYRIPDKVERGAIYAVAGSMDGYYDQYNNSMTWTDQDPDEYKLDIGLSK